MLAPNARLRVQVTALARQAPAPLPDAAHAPHAPARSPARTLWAVLLARIYEIFPLRCVLCGTPMRIIALVTDQAAVKTILGHLSEPTAPPEAAPARGPPLWDLVAEPAAHWGEAPAPLPEFVFDQRVSWQPGLASPLCLARACSHRLEGQALPHAPRTRTRIPPSLRTITVNYPATRFPRPFPPLAGQSNTWP